MPISVTNGHTMKFTHNFIVLLLFFVINTWALVKRRKVSRPEKVRIQLYYEVSCPYCIRFGVNKLAPVVKTMSPYLIIQTYPFGHAKMIDHNGKIEFKCQHGPNECYGNKIHACALDKLKRTTALLYNICLMNSTRSDDKSADRCGKLMNINSEPIKNCAKGTKGSELLRYYGQESRKAKFSHVPHVLINGKKYDLKDDFKKAVCAAFTKPPPPCAKILM